MRQLHQIPRCFYTAPSKPAGPLWLPESVCTLRCKFCAAVEGVAEATLQNEVSEPARGGTNFANVARYNYPRIGRGRHYQHNVDHFHITLSSVELPGVRADIVSA